MLDNPVVNALNNTWVMLGLAVVLVGLVIVMMKIRNKRDDD